MDLEIEFLTGEVDVEMAITEFEPHPVEREADGSVELPGDLGGPSEAGSAKVGIERKVDRQRGLDAAADADQRVHPSLASEQIGVNEAKSHHRPQGKISMGLK